MKNTCLIPYFVQEQRVRCNVAILREGGEWVFGRDIESLIGALNNLGLDVNRGINFEVRYDSAPFDDSCHDCASLSYKLYHGKPRFHISKLFPTKYIRKTQGVVGAVVFFWKIN